MADTQQITVRNLLIGDRTVRGEIIRAVRPLRNQGRNRYVSTHRNVCIEGADGTKRWATWNASTLITIRSRSLVAA